MNVGNAKPAFTSTAQKEDLLKHMATACHQRWSRRNWWRKREPASKPDKNLSQEFKFLIPKSEPQWPSPVLPFSAPGLLDDHGVLLDPEKTLEETQQFLERTVSGGKNWPVFLKAEQDLAQTAPSLSTPNGKRCSTPHPDLPNAGKKNLTGLMEKNNISVPLDCTTKVVGFKMVDGKKHLVLKVIPSNKQGVLPPKNSKSVESGTCSQTPNDQKVERNQSNDISTNDVPRSSDFLYSVAERRRWPQGDGHHKQSHTDGNTNISNSGSELNHKATSHQSTKELPLYSEKSHIMLKQMFPPAERVKDCQDKALRESEENFTTNQGDSGCHSDRAQCSSVDTGSLHERCHSPFITRRKEQNPALSSNITDLSEKEGTSDKESSNTDSCNESRWISDFDCFSSVCRSPLKDVTASLHHLECEVGDVLFHSSGDECTNNTDPRESLLPAGQSDCEMLPAELYQTGDELPLTAVRYLLDGASAGPKLSSDHSDEGTYTRGAEQKSEPISTDVLPSQPGDSESPVFIPSVVESSEHSRTESSVPLASLSEPALNQKPVVEVLFNDSRELVSKSQKPSGPEESDIITSVLHWEPVSRDVSRTLRLGPYRSSQPIKIPRDNQPVVVLNHPDSEIPEVTNIMKVVHKHKGAAQRIVLSRKTLRALSEFHCEAFQNDVTADCHASHCRRAWPNATVKERFSLKLRLKRVCGRKYTVVPTVLESNMVQPTFRCWFCGRLFLNQEVWVGHGQRHLMEATRGWNQLFNR